MPRIKYIEHNGTEHEVDAEVGISVMQRRISFPVSTQIVVASALVRHVT